MNFSSAGSDSRDCVDLIIDSPGDNTIRPASPEMLKYLIPERERLVRLGVLPPLKPPKEKPVEAKGDADGAGGAAAKPS